jgi:starch-binding outer membrane protein, SusD/RagB family
MFKYIFIASILFITAASCKKYLEKDPVDKLTTEQAFSSEPNLQLYINSFYAQMLPAGPAIYQSEVMSDNTVPRQVPIYIAGTINSQNVTGWVWNNLRNVNYFIANNTNPAIPQKARDHFTGIARFFRAYFYYDMVKTYGDVPWYGKPLDVADPGLYKPRDSRILVMDSVLADLDFACNNIYAIKDNSATQVTRLTALAFKSRVCLFEGTFRKYHGLNNFDKWLQEAAASANQLITSNQYRLQTATGSDRDYRSLFISETPVSAEVILAAVYNNVLRKWHGATQWYNSASAGDRLGLAKRFVNTYLNIDGTRFTEISGFDTLPFQLEMKNRDKRLTQSVRGPLYKRSDNTVALPDFNVTYSGYQLLKFSLDDKYYDSRGEANNSIPIIRYAEVLLNYAEAKAESGTLTTADWNLTIGALRARAGITNTAMPSAVDIYLQTNYYPDINNAVLLEIRRERGIEMVGEGFRIDDLKRWKAGKLLEKVYDGIYVPAMNTLLDLNEDGKMDVSFVTSNPPSPVAGVTYFIINNSTTKLSQGTKGNILWLSNISKKFEDKHYYYPIPAPQIILNPQLVQNTGW